MACRNLGVELVPDAIQSPVPTRGNGRLFAWASSAPHLQQFKRAHSPLARSLTLREACNKIIHAELFNWKRFAESRVDTLGLAPQVVLYGSRGEKKWRCRISIDQFVECACFQLSYTG